jgi:zinc/manganese transport system permease protein
MEILQFLLAPFVASLILTGIHAYLGVHVVERGVIFVDLALAQIAALGATIAILAGMDPHAEGAYSISLAFTFLGAALFALARMRRSHIPQEAFIGIAYAVASAAAILAMSKATGETEHLKDMLVGNILAVSWKEVGHTALLYGVIGLFHYIYRKKFLLISIDPRGAEAQGVSIRWWDFLFYASFGFVVTSSVAIAGVLLVFCYLIVPSVGAMLFADRIGPRLAIGWTMGTLVSALGVLLSVKLDLPTGATIVCTFGGVLVLMFCLHVALYHLRGKALEGGRTEAIGLAQKPHSALGTQDEPTSPPGRRSPRL